jgi:hypothetical protein
MQADNGAKRGHNKVVDYSECPRAAPLSARTPSESESDHLLKVSTLSNVATL